MNETILNNVNRVVQPDDTLYYLGDLCFGGDVINKIYNYIRPAINCRNIHFILGNHDDHILRNRRKLIDDHIFSSIEWGWYERKPWPGFHLSHCAHAVWFNSHKGSYNIFGHSHNTLSDDPNLLRVDVGVNGWNYFPVNFEAIKDHMRDKKWLQVDHHNKETN